MSTRNSAPLALWLAMGCSPIEQDPPFVVGVDATHANRHTLDGTFEAFGRVIREQGDEKGRRYAVRSVDGELDQAELAALDVLVIAGAVDEVSRLEVRRIEAWVRDGGALLLVADHHPFPAAVRNLADQFGFSLVNGWVHDGTRGSELVLSIDNGTLHEHPITLWPHGEVRRVVPEGGSAFSIPDGAVSIGELGPGWMMSQPEHGLTLEAEGLSMLAALEVDGGRVVLSSEASMLTCQEQPDGTAIGLCQPGREDQETLVRNAAHWLATGVDPRQLEPVD